MSKEITFILEPDNGKVTTEVSGISTEILTNLRSNLGVSQNVNCAKPLQEDVVNLTDRTAPSSDNSRSIWLYRIYHNSVVDGPGRRSVIQVAGCSIRCPGCYVPETHNQTNGKLVPIASVVKEIEVHRASHDGVTILGGEPFDQPGAVAELISRLRYNSTHIAVYTGNTFEQLLQAKNPAIDYIITHVDLLEDGPFKVQSD